MVNYLVRRLFIMVPTLLAISLIVFLIIELPPGDYLESYISELQAQGETVDQKHIEFLREQYGFDKPVMTRYWEWVTGMMVGDFGFSFEYRLPVSDVVGDRLLLTILVSMVTIIFTWIIAFPIGLYSATHQYSWGDYGLTFIGLLGFIIFAFILIHSWSFSIHSLGFFVFIRVTHSWDFFIVVIHSWDFYVHSWSFFIIMFRIAFINVVIICIITTVIIWIIIWIILRVIIVVIVIYSCGLNIIVFKLDIIFVTFEINVQDVQVLIITGGEGKLFGSFGSAC